MSLHCPVTIVKHIVMLIDNCSTRNCCRDGSIASNTRVTRSALSAPKLPRHSLLARFVSAAGPSTVVSKKTPEKSAQRQI
eukprot:5127284-Amphidinium_carterae.2